MTAPGVSDTIAARSLEEATVADGGGRTTDPRMEAEMVGVPRFKRTSPAEGARRASRSGSMTTRNATRTVTR